MCGQTDDPSQNDAFNRAEDARIEALIADKYPSITELRERQMALYQQRERPDAEACHEIGCDSPRTPGSIYCNDHNGLVDVFDTLDESDEEMSFLQFTYLDLVMIRDGVELLTPEDPHEIERRANMLALLNGEIANLEPIGHA